MFTFTLFSSQFNFWPLAHNMGQNVTAVIFELNFVIILLSDMEGGPGTSSSSGLRRSRGVNWTEVVWFILS